MAREVKKKHLDDSLQFTDNFDEDMLDIIEKKHLDSEPSSAMNDQTDTLPSLDDVQDDVPSLEPDGIDKESEVNLPSREGTDAAVPGIMSFLKRITWKKQLQIGSAFIFVIVIASISWGYFHHRSAAPSHPTTVIRHPITIPHHQQTATFFLYVDTGQKKDVFELAMELDFYGESAPLELEGKGILFRDKIYQFLQSQKPPESSYRYWEQIVQKDLPVCLKTTFPKSCPQSIRLTRFSRL